METGAAGRYTKTLSAAEYSSSAGLFLDLLPGARRKPIIRKITALIGSDGTAPAAIYTRYQLRYCYVISRWTADIT